jgi:hypothetical protein
MIINYIVKSIIISPLFLVWWLNEPVTDWRKFSRILVRVVMDMGKWSEECIIGSGD